LKGRDPASLRRGGCRGLLEAFEASMEMRMGGLNVALEWSLIGRVKFSLFDTPPRRLRRDRPLRFALRDPIVREGDTGNHCLSSRHGGGVDPFQRGTDSFELWVTVRLYEAYSTYFPGISCSRAPLSLKYPFSEKRSSSSSSSTRQICLYA